MYYQQRLHNVCPCYLQRQHSKNRNRNPLFKTSFRAMDSSQPRGGLTTLQGLTCFGSQVGCWGDASAIAARLGSFRRCRRRGTLIEMPITALCRRLARDTRCHKRPKPFGFGVQCEVCRLFSPIRHKAGQACKAFGLHITFARTDTTFVGHQPME
jgi:hypothetical protein